MSTTEQQPITVGTRVHSILYGGRDGTVVHTHDWHPEGVVLFPGTASKAEHDIVWDDGSRAFHVAELIMRGCQWRILEETVPLEEIEALKIKADEHAMKKAQEAEKRAQAKIAETARLVAEHSMLEQGSGAKIGAKNLRTQLKQSFAWVKFSVRSDHDSIRVEWTDGPTVEQVEEITRNYSLGHFDGMDDSYRYDDARTWPFGGTRYVFENRTMSDETRADSTRIVEERYSANTDKEQVRHTCYRKTPIPAGHYLTGITDESFPSFTTAPK